MHSALNGMIYRDYSVGDFVRIWLAGHSGEMTEGKIIHKFAHPHATETLYVIELEHELGANYEVRSGFLLQMRPSVGVSEYESWGK